MELIRKIILKYLSFAQFTNCMLPNKNKNMLICVAISVLDLQYLYVCMTSKWGFISFLITLSLKENV